MKILVTGLVVGILAIGLLSSPFMTGLPMVQQAFAQAEDDDDDATVKNVLLIANEHKLKIAPDNPLHPGGIEYSAMTFNGTIPGPAIAADVGDVLNITVRNEGKTIHSLDFHAGLGPSDVLSGNIDPGETVSWTLTAHNPGAFMYHCGADALNGVWEHVANGMYGAVIVHPEDEEEAKEFYLSFGEIYNSADGGLFVGTNDTVGTFDLGKWATDQPDLILTNGMAHKYVPAIGETAVIPLNPEAELFQVTPGELTRWYVLSPGPNSGVAFHFISGQIDVRDGGSEDGDEYGTQVINDETWWVPPGSASVFESTFPEEGVYVGVDHNLNHAVRGAAFAVLATPNATATDHPAGTCVAPKGSESVSADWCPQPVVEETASNATETASNATETASNATDSMQNATLAFAEEGAMMEENATDSMQNATLAFAEEGAMMEENATDSMQNATLAFAEEGAMMEENATDSMQNATLAFAEEGAMMEENATDSMQNATLAFAEEGAMMEENATDSMQNATLAFAEEGAMMEENATDSMQNATLAFAEEGAMMEENATDSMQNATLAFAETATVSMPVGSANPDNAEFYIPSNLEISAGTTVTWTNDDNTLHTATSGDPNTMESDGTFDSGFMAAGATFEHTFDEAGEFPYFCTLHPFMTGTVTVS